MVRRFLSLVALSASLAVLPVIGVQADTGVSTVCSVDLTTTFDPGLNFSLRSQKIQGSGTAFDCVGGGVTSATVVARGRGEASCTTGTVVAGALVRWNTGDESRIRIDIDIASGLAEGVVVSGLFAGDPVTADLTIEPTQGNCIIRPVTKARATGTVTIG